MLAAAVGGCAITDPVDHRYDYIGRSLAASRNDSIFLNIVRASHDYPLSFTTIGSVSPSMSNTTTLGLPQFLVGPNPQCQVFAGAVGSAACLSVPSSPGRDVIFGNNNATNALQVSSSFNISTEETAQFYDGFLKPVDLYILDYFIRQGYSRELIFWLFMDSFRLKFGSKQLGFQYNPPYDYGCPQDEPRKRCFREFVQIATVTGLSVETKTVDTSGGGGGNSDKGNAGGPPSSSGGGGGGGGSSKGNKVYSRFCFDPILGQRALNAMQQANPERLRELQAFIDPPNIYRRSPICGTEWIPDPMAGETDTLTFQVGPAQFIMQPRSAFSMFQFLGNLIKEHRDPPPDVPAPYVPREDERELPLLATVIDDNSFFTVTRNTSAGCFTTTWFTDGDYCVPETAANTKRIFSILAQLIAIQTQASDLSYTPNVRVIQ